MGRTRSILTSVLALFFTQAAIAVAESPRLATTAAPAAQAQTVFRARLSDAQVQQILTRIRTAADTLRRGVNSRYGYRQSLEPEVISTADDVIQATEHLADHILRRQTTRLDVEDVLRRGASLETTLAAQQSTTQLQNIWTGLRRDLDALASAYNITWDWRNPQYSPIGSDNRLYRQLTGTYELDAARSDTPARVADRALTQVPANQRARVQRQITNRLTPPDAIAIDRQDDRVTIASSKADQTTFTVNGRTQTETGPAGRTTSTRATSFGDAIEVTTTGANGTSFSATFEPMDGGNTLRMTRRLFDDSLTQPIVVNSVYRRTSQTPDWSLYDEWRTRPSGATTTPGRSPNEYVLPNGTTLVATLDQQVTLSSSRQNDRITLTVRNGPRAELQNAVIEGSVVPAPSGTRGFSVDFDTIRLRDGRTGDFTGTIEQVRGPNGDTITFNGERLGSDQNRSNQAIQRGAIGAALGAIIGAIAGGGKGAAIGAVLGGGGAAATVFIDSPNQVLARGTEFTIRAEATSPIR